MLLKNDGDHSIKPDNLVFILAIAGRLDAQVQLVAQKIHKDRSIYYTYTIVDSLSSSYSMYKYFFDVAIGGNADKMHESMMSPTAIVAIGLETCFLVGLSFFSYYFTKNKKNPHAIKTLIIKAGPVLRDIMKGLKNGYKGWRSTVMAFATLGGANIQYLIMPVGIAFGILAIANRLILKSFDDKLQNKTKNYSALLQEILDLSSLTEEESHPFLIRIQSNSQDFCIKAFMLCATGALFDGLYLYMGVLTLTVFPVPILSTMVVICSFYTLCCMLTRIYEEYEKQLSLLILHSQCQLVWVSKRLETDYGYLLLLEAKKNKSKADNFEIIRLKKSLDLLIAEFEDKCLLLEKQTQRSYWVAALTGMKNGLSAYSVLASIVFTISAFMLLAGASFSPLLALTTVSLGLAIIIGFMIHAFVGHYHHLQALKNEKPYNSLITIKPAPQNTSKGWTEVFRSLFSGLGKGQKYSDFVLNPLQEIGSNGHYQDSPLMCVLASINALFFGSVFSLRALAKEVGEPSPSGPRDLVSNPVVLERIRDHARKSPNILSFPEKKISTSVNNFFKPVNHSVEPSVIYSPNDNRINGVKLN